MMSLSNIFKAVSDGEKRVIEIAQPKRQTVEALKAKSPEEAAKDMMDSAQLEANKIREKALQERDAVFQSINEEKEAWKVEKETERQAAREEGYAEGFTLGSEQAKAEWSKLIETARGIVHSAEEDYKKYLQKQEEDILNLAVAVAGRIVSDVLDKDPESWVHLIRNAIKEVRDQDAIKIIVSPSRYSEVVENRDVLQSVSRDARIQIFPDESLEENGCFIETAYGRIDASVDRQLSIIKQTLAQYLEAPFDGN